MAIVGSGREENRNNSYPHTANLAQPSGLAISQELRSVFFADSESSAIRRVHLDDGKVSAVCGADKNPSVSKKKFFISLENEKLSLNEKLINITNRFLYYFHRICIVLVILMENNIQQNCSIHLELFGILPGK